ncbi:MAG: hypothetical protein ACXVR1_15940 [Solirubrobacteraceae bacterium]
MRVDLCVQKRWTPARRPPEIAERYQRADAPLDAHDADAQLRRADAAMFATWRRGALGGDVY